MKIFRNSIIALVSILMSHLPQVAVAEVVQKTAPAMIPTSAVLADLNRADIENEIRDFLITSEVRSQLAANGLSDSEISGRLAGLSHQELMQLSSQVKEAKAGGDILVTILLVVLIIYLVKRI